VDIVFPQCPQEPFSFDAVLSALRIELVQEGVVALRRVTEPEGSEQARIELVAACQPTLSSLLIRIYTPNEPTAVRAMDISDLPLALRPRGVALATAELARSVWLRPTGPAAAPGHPSRVEYPTERPSLPTAGVVPSPSSSGALLTGPVASPPAKARPDLSPVPRQAITQPYGQGPGTSAASPVLDLAGCLGMRVYFPDATALFGPRLSLRFRRLRVGVDAAAGRRVDPLGEVSLFTVTGLVGLDAWTHTASDWRLRVGPRASAGLAMASADAWGGPHTATARETYLDAALEAGAEAWIAARWAAFTDLEVGRAQGLTVNADQRPAGSIGGWLLGVRFGVSIVP
jgi:hypothetical protein